MKTSSLMGEPLDRAVAQAMGRKDTDFGWWWDNFKPSTNWAQGGPIIEREKLEFRKVGIHTWLAETQCGHNDQSETGPTPLIAAMRCFVASKLGDTIDILKERA